MCTHVSRLLHLHTYNKSDVLDGLSWQLVQTACYYNVLDSQDPCIAFQTRLGGTVV